LTDEETGFYYLQSRYYNPEVGRFISSDVLLSTGQGVLGHNAYAYCLNNPVNREDYTGHRASLVHTDIGIPLGGDGYIDGQSNFYGSDLSFGPAGNVADNGCGLVALYNVAKAGGLPYSFNELHDILFGGLGWVGTTNFFGSMGNESKSYYGVLRTKFWQCRF
jgi:RHS repeat-associated protein